MLLFLHRNLFVQALIEDPDDPIRSQYAPSFLATVRAARNILQSVEGQLRVQRVIVSRFWTIWTYTFSATVCVSVLDAQDTWPHHFHLLGRLCLYCHARSTLVSRE